MTNLFKRKEGPFDYLWENRDKKFTEQGPNVESVSWAGCEAASEWLRKNYRFDTHNTNMPLVYRERIGFAWNGINADGNGQGKWHKRLANYIKHNYDINIDVEALGNLIEPYRVSHQEMTFDFTNNFTWTGGDFGDPTSCFFGGGGYSGQRIWIMQNGFLAIRIYESPTGKGAGRAWIAPTEDGEFMLWNAYGARLIDLATLAFNFVRPRMKEPRIVKVFMDIRENGKPKGLYHNMKESFLITDNPKIQTDEMIVVNFGWIPDECIRCGKEYRNSSGWYIDTSHRRALCSDCVRIRDCCICGSPMFSRDELSERKINSSNRLVHTACWDEYYDICHRCEDGINKRNLYDYEGQHYCKYCLEGMGLEYCNKCEKYTKGKHYTVRNYGTLCGECKKTMEGIDYCQCCHQWSTDVETREDGVKACGKCVWYCEAIVTKSGKCCGKKYSRKTNHSGDYMCPDCVEKGRSVYHYNAPREKETA